MLLVVCKYLHLLKSGDFCTQPVCYRTRVPLLMSSFAIPQCPSSSSDWGNPKGWERLVREGTYGPKHLHGSKNRGTGPPAFGRGEEYNSHVEKSNPLCWEWVKGESRNEQSESWGWNSFPVQKRAPSLCCCVFLQLIKNENLTPKHTFSKFDISFPPNFHVLVEAGRQNVVLFIFPLLIFCMSMHLNHTNRQGPLHVFYWVSNSKSPFEKLWNENNFTVPPSFWLTLTVTLLAKVQKLMTAPCCAEMPWTVRW